MATTYTTNYNLGKQENHADKFDMDVITDNADKIDAALTGLQSGIDGKQATLTTAQLAAVNSGITSTDVTQIETNKNNILFVNQKVGVNLVNSASGSGTRWINVEVDLPVGTYTCGFSSLTGDDSGVSQVTFYGADYAIIQPERSQISKGNNVYVKNIVVTGTVKTIRIYAASDSTTSQNKGVSYTNLFVCKQEAWDASVGVQPYAMSNAELTANTAIEDISDKITAASGYTINSLTKLYKQNNRVFGQVVISKDTGSFGGAQELIASFNSGYRPKDIQIQGCFFGSTAYNAEYTGYTYIQLATASSNAGDITVKGYQTSVGTVVHIHVDFVI